MDQLTLFLLSVIQVIQAFSAIIVLMNCLTSNSYYSSQVAVLTAIISKMTVNCFMVILFSLQDEATMCTCECVVSGCMLVCIYQTSKQVPLPASFGSKQSYNCLLCFCRLGFSESTNAVKIKA